MKEMSVRSAAKQLGLSEQRVRALLKAGRIKGRKIGSSWIVEDGPYLADSRPHGRPLAGSNAWALLALLSKQDPSWVDPSVRSRLRRWIGQRDIVQLIRESAPRSSLHQWRVLPADILMIQDLYPIVRSGLSASGSQLDIVPIPGALDSYVDQASLDAIEGRFRPEVDSARPNIVLRVPVQDWILSFHDAPAPVAAADLLLHEDPRVARAAAQLLESFTDG